jgi:hypothetical protein
MPDDSCRKQYAGAARLREDDPVIGKESRIRARASRFCPRPRFLPLRARVPLWIWTCTCHFWSEGKRDETSLHLDLSISLSLSLSLSAAGSFRANETFRVEGKSETSSEFAIKDHFVFTTHGGWISGSISVPNTPDAYSPPDVAYYLRRGEIISNFR